jgi:1,4-dihydroxy-2-naphthoyl-CoA synthase
LDDADSQRWMASRARATALAGEYGITWLLPRMIGAERATDLLISGRAVDADEVLKIGLVSRVTEPGEVLTAATAYARDVAANCSPASMALIKHQVLAGLDASYEQSIRRAYRAMALPAEGPDFCGGIDSFLQQRPPKFPPLPADLDPAAITGTGIPALTIDPMKHIGRLSASSRSGPASPSERCAPQARRRTG